MDQEIPAGTLADLSLDSPMLISDHAATKSVYDPRVIKDIDENAAGPLWCPHLAPEIFNNLRALECKKRRPLKSTEVDEERGYYIDWFVNIVQVLGFSRETLYYAVKYFDSCTMGKVGGDMGIGLLSLACVILASKYEEVSCPSINKYSEKYFFSAQQIADMEISVLKSLEYDLSSPTTWSFMERFIQAAQDGPELRCMASYIAELSLYSYNMNVYLPSMAAASSVFLARYILRPSQMPWNPTLQHYTLYDPPNLRDCVKELYDIVIGRTYNFPGIRDKYCKFLHSRVALKPVPSFIPEEYFTSI